jgi:hypothetical protein
MPKAQPSGDGEPKRKEKTNPTFLILSINQSAVSIFLYFDALVSLTIIYKRIYGF